MLQWLRKDPEKQRQKLLSVVHDPSLLRYLEVPLPDPAQNLLQTEFVALDFETTGLDATQEAILSIGYTVIREGRIVLRENGYHLIRVNKPIPEKSVVIHHITDDRMAEGAPLHEVMPGLLAKIAGRVLLVHYQAIEKKFLNAACKELYGYELPARYVDTLEIARRRLARAPMRYGPHHLRLFNLRDYYKLPRYNAHNALEDAIATAELFFAEIAQKRRPLERIRLKEVL